MIATFTVAIMHIIIIHHETYGYLVRVGVLLFRGALGLLNSHTVKSTDNKNYYLHVKQCKYRSSHFFQFFYL